MQAREVGADQLAEDEEAPAMTRPLPRAMKEDASRFGGSDKLGLALMRISSPWPLKPTKNCFPGLPRPL